MTKVELVREISTRTGVDRATALAVVESMMETVKEVMSSGENIYLRGFGTYLVKSRAEKTARNISKNVTIRIPGHKIPMFKPCKEFKEMMK